PGLAARPLPEDLRPRRLEDVLVEVDRVGEGLEGFAGVDREGQARRASREALTFAELEGGAGGLYRTPGPAPVILDRLTNIVEDRDRAAYQGPWVNRAARLPVNDFRGFQGEGVLARRPSWRHAEEHLADFLVLVRPDRSCPLAHTEICDPELPEAVQLCRLIR